ncbi:biotin/lipoyl-binding protein [Caproiciproducens sp. AGMB10547]|uniref:Biotin/lipoyl-binding protein n=1 Tax=Caproiciproducens faecalis TaxID=2820301 RepID=A0ABS7DLA2_9FIRM|nr:biotin/lipoyl-binding protein [Caproiciproducens faecalis]MBW7572083.1 biotin/lipoyl-binding protein [Caproiciproducens faecalis]
MKKWVSLHKKISLILGGVLVALVVVFGISQFQKEPAAKGNIPLPSAAQSNELDAWGEVKYGTAVDINIDFPSIVTGVSVKEGDRVTFGQILVTLDLSEYQGILDKLKQQVAANEAGLPAAEQSIAALEADIAQTQSLLNRKSGEYRSGTSPDLKLLQNSLTLANQEVADAKRDLQNNQTLYNSGAVSKATLNQYVSALNQKQKALTDVQYNLTKAKNALKEEVDQLTVSLQSKKTQLDTLKNSNTANTAKQQSGLTAAQVDLNLMTAKTAKDYLKGNQIVCGLKKGIIQGIAVSNADPLGVQNAPTRVLQIIDADSLTISAEVDEVFIGKVKLGDTVRIVPTSAPDVALSGTVTQIPNLAQEKDGKRVVRVLVKPSDPNQLLKPGYTADVYFSLK